MDSHSVYDVFTPSRIANLNYIERASINGRIASALATPGRQIVIFGHSGVGKSSLLRKSLEKTYEREIITHCMASMTFEGIILDAFDRLDKFYIEKKTKAKSETIKGSFSASYFTIKSSIDASKQKSDTEALTRIIATQLTPQRLADFLGEGNYCWILEDFHKMDKSEKIKLSQIMKVFMDKSVDYPQLKVVALGAVNTGREVIQYDDEMKRRISEIEVGLMSKEELKHIIINGEKLLNINFADDIKRDITNFSNGLASICHALCLYICEEKGIKVTWSGEPMKLGKKELTHAITRYIDEESDTIKHKFDVAFKQKDTKFKNAELIFRALGKFSAEGATYADLLRTIKDERGDYPQSNLTAYLSQLQLESKGGTIRFDNSSGKYSFSEPFYRPYILALFKSYNESESKKSLKDAIGYIAYKLIAAELEQKYLQSNKS